jgi:hypothetical protein
MRSTFLLLTPSSPLGPLVFALALASWPKMLHAAEFADPSGGFSMRVELDGASTCAVYPKPASDGACDGLNLDAMREGLAATEEPPLGLAIVRRDDSTLIVNLSKGAVRTVTAESIEQTIEGSEDAMKKAVPGVPARVHGDEPAKRFDVLEVNGANCVRYAIDLDVPPEHPRYAMSRMLTYLIAARDVTYNVTISGTPENAKDVRLLGDAIMKTLRVPPSKNDAFGQPRARALGRAVGSFLGLLIPVAVLIVLVATLGKRRKNQKRA